MVEMAKFNNQRVITQVDKQSYCSCVLLQTVSELWSGHEFMKR